ncbi:cytochrome c-type biogenesis protein [Yoonia sp. BS5-3]|uniref:Cytochrome c-type biogenesis protein n=1 Tax=Yoonia phaeophyticola TaxID=3137369 RepID=A0ABZ2V119_9RHOB
MRWFAVVLCLWAIPLWAVEPDEILADPVLEARAREISRGLRCPVCQNESIDESNASLAKDLRILLRERLVAGDTDAQAIDFIVQRYGEFVLLRPDTQGANLILWIAAPIMLLIALGIGWTAIGRKGATVTALSEAEKAELEKILRS